MRRKPAFFFIFALAICFLYNVTVLAQTIRDDDSKHLPTKSPEGEKTKKLPDPLVDKDLKLIPLSQEKSIFLAQDRSCLIVLGEICLREGMLEFFLCSNNSKEHESIIATKAKPSLIHVGLLAMGAEPGKSVQYTPNFIAASGPQINITVRWLDQNGKQQEAKAEEWVQESKTKNQMSTHWVFTGSMFQKLENNKNQYLADVTGEIIGVSNFPTVVLDLPIESTSDNSVLLFQAYTERIPPVGTPVTIILKKEGEKR